MWIAVKHPATLATGVAAWRAGRLTLPPEAAGEALAGAGPGALPPEVPTSEITR